MQSFEEAKNAGLEGAKNIARTLKPYFENIYSKNDTRELATNGHINLFEGIIFWSCRKYVNQICKIVKSTYLFRNFLY